MKPFLLAPILALAATPALAQHEGHGVAPEAPAAKLSLGALRDIRVAPHLRLAAGGLWSFNFVPASLEPSYGGDRDGAMIFLRVTID